MWKSCKEKVLEKCIKRTHITLVDQNKLVFQKLDAIMNPELILKFPNLLFMIDSLRFHFKVVAQVVLKK